MATTDVTGNWIDNVAGSGSLTLHNVVFNYGPHAAYDYGKVTDPISQNDGVRKPGWRRSGRSSREREASMRARERSGRERSQRRKGVASWSWS